MLKNITLSAEAQLIKKARLKARKQGKVLNVVFREWLSRYAATDSQVTDYDQMIASMKYAQSGGAFTRDEMNER